MKQYVLRVVAGGILGFIVGYGVNKPTTYQLAPRATSIVKEKEDCELKGGILWIHPNYGAEKFPQYTMRCVESVVERTFSEHIF